MATFQEQQDNALTVARTLGDIPTNTTPADAQAVIDQLADRQVFDNSVRLLRQLGWEQPAAA
ncbi:hypothetical protein OG689_10870 [Kitasatospora sp. NBC_00240]|uniref:hypothetical protein n=1 Tax=Kitasatospora sp. NBC_00240 TaxID=2903567 RepID=UPI0022597F48|nr:hypothetical protein [Kitasatospora sp. NBC_00240]MCX5209786.1 hypothetical protein [Kitasatospora sp. NBC_00240]